MSLVQSGPIKDGNSWLSNTACVKKCICLSTKTKLDIIYFKKVYTYNITPYKVTYVLNTNDAIHYLRKTCQVVGRAALSSSGRNLEDS